MAKTLKDFLNERQLGPMVVKNPDEQKFVDKHVVAKHADRNGNGDEVFKASKVKMDDRRKDRHGYNPGEDEKVYEELKGNQHKIDANKNGKIDAEDFKHLRKKKKVAEEAEQIDELSKKTLATYAIKAKNQMGRDEGRAGYQRGIRTMDGKGQGEMERAHDKRAEKRSKGIDTALNKLAKEEVEQIDELSPSTMGSYTKKAAADFKARKPKMGYDGQLKKMQNRKVGVDRALKKMYGEETEQLDELSPATMTNYLRATSRTAKSPKDSDKRKRGAMMAVKKLSKEEAQIDEKIDMKKADMGDVVKDFQKSDAPQFKGKSQDKRRAMAIAAKLTAERGGKPLRKEEKLAELLGDLTESHRRTMLSVFDKLNEDNQKKFLEACESEEGIDAMLDFSISHRGE